MFLGTQIFTFLLILVVHTVNAQAIDNTASFRAVQAKAFVRFSYDNDYFTATDYYYTQGMNLEWVSPSLNGYFLNKVLIAPKQMKRQWGIALEHNGYTPTSIESDSILYGDRPFASALMVKNFSMSADSTRRLRITSSLSLGVMGHVAGGQEVQESIHRWIHDTQPIGWQYQIQNDIVVNYEASIEKNLMNSPNFLFNGFASGRLGTLNAKISSGVVLMLGRMNDRILSAFGTSSLRKHRVHFHGYIQPAFDLVGYDAMLQGGLINLSSPYTLSADMIDRFVFRSNYGLVLEFPSVYLEYYQSFRSAEFEGGKAHEWGGVKVGVAIGGRE